jgi:thiol-disulfide isomerase/thioredoxin
MKKVLVFVWLAPCLWCAAQRNIIGSRLPDEILQGVINYTNDSLRISQLKKKLVILDFWSTSCAACIHAFPGLDSLQKKFDQDIQIVLVNKESRDSTLKFFAKRKKIKMPHVLFITGDKQLHEYFPYHGYPYQVWIDSQQTARFFTASYNATEEHINDFIAGKKLELDSLKTTIFSGSILKSKNQEWIDAINYYSLITKCTKGLSVGYANGMLENSRVYLRSNCASIAELFQKAFEEYERYDLRLSSKIIIQLPNTYPYMRPDDPNMTDAWEKEHSYNYELVLPGESKNEIYEYMQADIQRFFGIDARIEKRMIPCIVLVRTSTKKRSKQKGENPKTGYG